MTSGPTVPNEREPLLSPGRAVQFDELRVRVGTRLQLLFDRFARTAQFPSTLIGYLDGQYVIARTPVEGGLRVTAENGEPLKVRLFTGTHVVEFATTVLRQFGPPVSYWHLEYPAAVDTVTLRAEPRARVDLPVQVRSAGAPDPVAARFVDLSSSGAQVIADRALGDRETVVELSFSVDAGADGAKGTVAVSARVKAVRAMPGAPDSAPGYAHGLQFENLGENDRIVLQNFVLNRLYDGPAAGA
jgi:c-di-GMP-binding flagellar brake protein YcgR